MDFEIKVEESLKNLWKFTKSVGAVGLTIFGAHQFVVYVGPVIRKGIEIILQAIL